MPKLIFLILFLFGLYGCASVSKEEVRYHAIGSADFSFKNKDLEFSYTPTILEEDIQIKITNLTNESLKIDWDKSAFINIEGNSLRVIHNGVKYNERNNSQVATSIPPKGRITDSLSPSDHISWFNENWWIEPICGIKNYPTWAWGDSTPSCFKGELGLFISYEISGKSKNFTVKFRSEKLEKPKK